MVGFFLQHLLTGFIVKSIASFDDTLTRIPIMAEVTRGRLGKIAFSIGTLLALTVILILIISFSHLLEAIPYRRYFVAGLIFILGLVVYFELFSPKKEERVQEKLINMQHISHARFFRLIGIGFIISFITYLDDAVVLVPLFLNYDAIFFSILGVYLAALVQIIVVIYFSKQISRIKYRKEIASAALIILSILVALGIV